jgi:hypothetical protein
MPNPNKGKLFIHLPAADSAMEPTEEDPSRLGSESSEEELSS